MADIKFACPSCAQHITCDELWSGQQIQCPSCQGNLTVPARVQARATGSTPPPPPPPSPGQAARSAGNSLVPQVPAATKLATAIPAQQPAQTGNKAVPIRNLAPPPPPKKNMLVTIAKVAGVLIVLAVGGYFGWGFLREWQDKANAETRKMEANADGGQVGHIADLHSVLDATEPGGSMGYASPSGSGPKERDSGIGAEIPMADPGGDPSATPKKAAPKLPILPVSHTLAVQHAKIPQSQVNGKIGGTDFVAEQIRLDRSPTTANAYVLRFTQGNIASPDREIQVFMRLKAGEKPAGYTQQVAAETTGSGIQVVKVWKPNPKYAPQRRTFGTGYALKVELGKLEEGTISGKIYAALPDTEETVIAGVFTATTSLVEGQEQPGMIANPAVAPAQALPSAESDAFRRRYGIQ